MSAATLLVGTLSLAVGTFAFRLLGPFLRARTTLSPQVEKLLATAIAVVFAALVVTSAMIDGQGFAGMARPLGVLVAGVLAWHASGPETGRTRRRAPFVVIVLAAAGTTALLRWAGVA